MRGAMEIGCAEHGIAPLWTHHSHSLEMGFYIRSGCGRGDTGMVYGEGSALDRSIRNQTPLGNLVAGNLEGGDIGEEETSHGKKVLRELKLSGNSCPSTQWLVLVGYRSCRGLLRHRFGRCRDDREVL